MIDVAKLGSFDWETYRFRGGEMAPKAVCASTAEVVAGRIEAKLLVGVEKPLAALRALLESGRPIAFANAAYDLAVAAQADPSLLPLIFRALDLGNVYDILIAQSLNDIFFGHLGKHADGSDLRKPLTGEVTKRYSLELVTFLLTGRVDAKANDVFRQSYALLDGIPVERWPRAAREYPLDDARNTIEDAIAQLLGRPGPHEWDRTPSADSVIHVACRHCGSKFEETQTRICSKAPIVGPHNNLDNLAAQVDADLCLKLGAAWSLRCDPERVAKLKAEVEAKHAKAVERFQKKGWIREDGTEDQAAVKRAIAAAYGASGTCKRCLGGCVCRKCDGTGKALMQVDGASTVKALATCPECKGIGKLIGRIRPTEIVDCRGLKEKGRYRGCLGASCMVCTGTGKLERAGNDKTCKVELDSEGKPWGCDGTGFDLSTAPLLPRTDKLGVKTDRDASMESGDDDISDYGENEFEKSRTTYVPYLETGIDAPLRYSPNVIVATGRCSYEDSPLHQMPRAGGERKCIRARGRWCGSPLEYVLGSTDYEAGELCTLAQFTYWLFGYSQMREAINRSGKPGILHSDLAAEVLGIQLDEFMKRLKAKDKQAVDFRQMCKPINFGTPGGMGEALLVLTSRKKNAGFTVCDGGPSRNEKGEPGYWGVRFCLLTGGAKQCGVEKILEWKRRPCAPVCKACVDVVAHMLRPAYFRRYPEVQHYFDWAKQMIDAGKPAPCVVYDPETNGPKILRLRGGCDFSSFCNNGFQAMLADIGKLAYRVATRECYLGYKADGSPSPLAGCRLPLYLHDEPLSELLLETAHLSGPRIAEIMVAAGQACAPDVTWKAETALAFWWDKGMEPAYDPTGKLVPWGPIPDEHKHRYAVAA